jgi:group I intron endonuclease
MPYGIIYCITNTVNGKQYVGQTKNSFSTRWRYHLYYAKNKLGTSIFHNAITKYGKEAFVSEELATCNTQKELDKREIFFITELKTKTPFGYNLTAGGNGITKNSCLKISASNKGLVKSPETRMKLSAVNKGKSIPKEVRNKISAALKGRKISFETRDKMSLGQLNRKQAPPNRFCKKGHPYDIITTYTNKGTEARCCLVCHYLSRASRGYPFPDRFKPYLK